MEKFILGFLAILILTLNTFTIAGPRSEICLFPINRFGKPFGTVQVFPEPENEVSSEEPSPRPSAPSSSSNALSSSRSSSSQGPVSINSISSVLGSGSGVLSSLPSDSALPASDKSRGSKKKKGKGKKPEGGDRDPNEKRYVYTNMNEEPKWVSVAELNEMVQNGENYLDVTNGKKKRSRRDAAGNGTVQYPKTVAHHKTVKSIISHISTSAMKDFVTHFSMDFFTRYMNDLEAMNASMWLKEQVEIIMRKYEGPCIAVNLRKEPALIMPSVIGRILGSDPILRRQIIVLCAHIDSLNHTHFGRLRGRAPGANDNGSGASVLLETLRVLVKSKFVPKRTIEFHWYSGEEFGLQGSYSVANEYDINMAHVVGAVNFDTVGFAPPGDVNAMKIGIPMNLVNAPLSKFLSLLVEQYGSIPWISHEICQICVSDHISWHKSGYPAAFPHEVMATPFLHTMNDTVETVNFDYAKEYVKMAVALSVEFGLPSTK